MGEEKDALKLGVTKAHRVNLTSVKDMGEEIDVLKLDVRKVQWEKHTSV